MANGFYRRQQYKHRRGEWRVRPMRPPSSPAAPSASRTSARRPLRGTTTATAAPRVLTPPCWAHPPQQNQELPEASNRPRSRVHLLPAVSEPTCSRILSRPTNRRGTLSRLRLHAEERHRTPRVQTMQPAPLPTQPLRANANLTQQEPRGQSHDARAKSPLEPRDSAKMPEPGAVSRCVNAQTSHGKGHPPFVPLISKGGPQYGLLTHLQGWQPQKQFTSGGRSGGKGFLSLDLPFPPPKHILPPTKGLLPISFSSPDYSDEVNLFFLSSAAAVCKGVLIPYICRFHVFSMYYTEDRQTASARRHRTKRWRRHIDQQPI